MAERGNSTHGRRLDEELKLETEDLTKTMRPGHLEEWRQPEPLPDDTDPDEVLEAMDPNGVEENATDRDEDAQDRQE